MRRRGLWACRSLPPLHESCPLVYLINITKREGKRPSQHKGRAEPSCEGIWGCSSSVGRAGGAQRINHQLLPLPWAAGRTTRAWGEGSVPKLKIPLCCWFLNHPGLSQPFAFGYWLKSESKARKADPQGTSRESAPGLVCLPRDVKIIHMI